MGKLEFIGIGEVLVDFSPMNFGSYVRNRGFYMNLGGAPFNSAVAYSRLGGSSGVIGAVGEDEFGKFILNTLKMYGVDHRGLVFKKSYRTSLAFIILDVDGEKSFFFYRKPWATTADTELLPSDIDADYVKESDWLHVSGMSLSHKPCRDAVFEAIKIAIKNNVSISFDPTIRLDVWVNEKELFDVYNRVFDKIDLLTLSIDEAEYLFDISDPSDLKEYVFKKFRKLRYLCVRLGGEGSYSAERSDNGFLEAFSPTIKIEKVVDTTGAGDAWNAAYIFSLNRGWALEKRIKFANVVASLKCRDYGAIRGLPTLDEALKYLKENS